MAKKAKAVKEVAVKEVAVKAVKVVVEKISQNGVTRPTSGTKTGEIWDIADELSHKAGTPVTRKEVLDICKKREINEATGATQYAKWRKFNGLTAALTPVAAVVDDEAEEQADDTAEELVEEEIEYAEDEA